MHFDFLLCSERGGSNLMTKIMDGHPDICGPFPSHAFRVFSRSYFRYGIIGIDSNWQALTDDIAFYLSRTFSHWESSITAAELREVVTSRSLAAVLRYAYEKEARTRGKNRLFVKENHAYLFNSYILEHFADARFVLLVRDPRDMAFCWKDSGFPNGIIGAAKTWQNDQLESIRIYSYLSDFSRMHIAKFEDILRNSEDTVRQICAFLEVEYSDSMLRFYEHENVRKNAASNFAWSDLAKPIQPDNCDLYRDHLSEEEMRYIEAVCRVEMEYLGYPLEYGDSLKSIEECEAKLPHAEPAGPHVERFGDEQQAMRKAWREAQERIIGRSLYLEE